MPQTFGVIYLHVIFSTKGREPFLANKDMRTRMHAYLSGTLARLDCPAVIIGGTSDHVHALFELSRDKTVSDVVRDLKRSSSHWAKKQGSIVAKKFAWQHGYAAFSVSVSGLSRTAKYIDLQREHHRKVGFQEEFRAFLRKHDAEFDERYMWD